MSMVSNLAHLVTFGLLWKSFRASMRSLLNTFKPFQKQSSVDTKSKLIEEVDLDCLLALLYAIQCSTSCGFLFYKINLFLGNITFNFFSFLRRAFDNICLIFKTKLLYYPRVWLNVGPVQHVSHFLLSLARVHASTFFQTGSRHINIFNIKLIVSTLNGKKL